MFPRGPGYCLNSKIGYGVGNYFSVCMSRNKHFKFFRPFPAKNCHKQSIMPKADYKALIFFYMLFHNF